MTKSEELLEQLCKDVKRIADCLEKPVLRSADELPESQALERKTEIFPKPNEQIVRRFDEAMSKKAPETKEGDKCEYDGFTYTEFKECKYKCGHLVSWQNYKKGDKPIHFLRNDKGQLIALGKKCPKYSKEDENK